jgi:hypothetical protein
MQRDRKIKSNRANARASTGPKTTYGRARSARNALRHGLSVRIESDGVQSEQVETLKDQIAGSDASVHIQILARRIAEAQVDLLRARNARHRHLSGSDYHSPAKFLAAMVRLARAVLADKPLSPGIIKTLDSKPEGRSSWQLSCRTTLVSSKRLSGMRGAPFRDGSLQFGRSMQSAAGHHAQTIIETLKAKYSKA